MAMTLKQAQYNDGLQPGGRRPRLYLVRKDGAHESAVKFTGQTVPGYCVVTAAQYQKCGKWSNTTYHLALDHGVRAAEFLSPLHGTWGDDCGSWADVARRCCLEEETAENIVRREYPSTARRLDELAVALARQADDAATTAVRAADDAANHVNLVIVSRHPAAIEFLRRELGAAWATAPVLAIAGEGDVRNAIVAGNLPLRLAAMAVEVIAIEFIGQPPRGAEYSLADMDAAGALLRRYSVRAVNP